MSCETVIGHHTTGMGKERPAVLHSGDPEGGVQEAWASFAVYQAISWLTGIAAGIP